MFKRRENQTESLVTEFKFLVAADILHLRILFVGTRVRSADGNRPIGGRVRSPHCCGCYII